MRKRMLALLLCISMLLPLFEASLPAAYAEETIPVETTAPTEAPTEVPTEVPTEAPIAVASEDYSADVGKYARLNSYYSDSMVFVHDGSNAFAMTDALAYDYADFEEGLIFRITDWYFDQINSAIWYQVEAYQGNLPEDMPAGYWIFQNYTSDGYEENTLLFVTIEEPEETCPICGQVGCAATHFYCDICKAYDCGRDHLYCNLCEKYDCTENHIWCGTCGAFDCGETHEDSYTPAQTPLIPENPTLTEGAAVSIADENGEAVTSDGLVLHAGRKLSLSAWTELEGEVSYRWQICYDMENDLWVNIQGQTGKGILVSPAMFLPLLQEQGDAALRCVAFCGEETKISDPIPVRMARQDVSYTLSGSSGSGTDAQAEGDGENLTKAYVVVQYIYADGRTAAAPTIAEIIPGAAVKPDKGHPLPVIQGYEASLSTNPYPGYVTINTKNELIIDIPAGVINEGTVTFTVTYHPTEVDYTVIHYQQNANDDKYKEVARETKQALTGTVIQDAHKEYAGFYNLIYATPAVAADGSTVIEVYYDRYYYLMKFEVGEGGYGVEPVYARYGAPIGTVPTPIRPGYVFNGWLLNGSGELITSDKMPTTMPNKDQTYVADWTEANTQYTVSYWVLNDDGTRTLLGTHINRGVTGAKVSGKNNLGTDEGYICNEESNHTHTDACYGCGKVEHNHTRDCFTNTKEYHPGDNGVAIIKKLGDSNPESGYIYVIKTTSGNLWPKLYLNGAYYTVNEVGHGSAASEDEVNTIVDGEAIGEVTDTVNGETLTVIKYKAKATCGSEQHIHDTSTTCAMTCSQHVHSDTCYVDTTYMEYVDDRVEEVEIKGDGTSIVNVYYQYKEYTLKFYYAATTGGTADDTDNNASTYDSIKIVGGTSYYFGSWGPDTSNDETLLENEYWNRSGQWGQVDELPTLNARGAARNYTIDDVTYEHTDGTLVTYHYISFTARYGDDISNLWPCGVFNSVTRTDKNNANGWSGTEAFVSAWNGEHHVKYSQENSNQTIKGIYERLDENLLFKLPNFTDESEVSYLCFWENGANIDWSVPELYRYNIYLETYAGQDLTGKTTATKDGKTYYLADSYDTCDNSTVGEQTQVSLMGYVKNGYTWSEITDFDTSLYKEAYDVNFFYNANRWPLVFWNHDDFLKDGAGSQAMYGEPLTKHFEGITVNGTEYEGANDLVVKDEYYPKTLEPNAYEFEGWYTSPVFGPETKVDPDNMFMPNEPLRVYAKWEPIDYRVDMHLTIKMDQVYDVHEDIPYGSVIGEIPDPEMDGYRFVGWFYQENGEEKAFDPANTPVKGNWNVYAKWISDTLYSYVVRFLLDSDGDGQPDQDGEGNYTEVALPITGSGIGGNSYTFDAKVGSELFFQYQAGYFPNLVSHTLVMENPDDDSGTITFDFLYQPQSSVSYTVKYLEKGTGKVLADQKTVTSSNVMVTENFVYVKDYLPDAYQKTLVLSTSGENEIIFEYTHDTQHALYVVNHYVQNLSQDHDGNWVSVGWTRYDGAQGMDVIGASITESAISITGYNLDVDITDDFNTTQKVNGAAKDANGNLKPLPAAVSELNNGEISGEIAKEGLELNFYYKPEYYDYEFRFLLSGTTTQLAEPVRGKAPYGATVSQTAKEILLDLDGDGVVEDYRLYNPSETVKHIPIDGVNDMETFYYVRATQTMTITKEVMDDPGAPDPNPPESFAFYLRIHAPNFHKMSYTSSKGELTPVLVSGVYVLPFTLQAGETITIQGLPTAEYTLTELNVPLGYYDSYAPAQKYKLTVDDEVNVTVTNTYDPANLEITKTVGVAEAGNIPEVEEFEFTITVPDGVTGTFSYTVSTKDEDGNVVNTEQKSVGVDDGHMVIGLQRNQTARFENLPLGKYTIEEKDYSAEGYKSSYTVNGLVPLSLNPSVEVEMVRGETQHVECVNNFPVGDLIIEKTVSKEFYKTLWSGDTFTFTIRRTSAGRPLKKDNAYSVYVDGTAMGTAKVDADGNLQVTITFDADDAALMDEADEDEATVVHTILIKNLPAGTYAVTEAENAAYTQTASGYTKTGEEQKEATVSGLNVSGLIIPANEIKASFSNELKRTNGNLSLLKKLVPAEGFPPEELPTNTKFTFTFTLLDKPPVGTKEITYVLTDAENNETTHKTNMVDGVFTIEIRMDQTVEIQGIPIGTYRIMEATIPRYANQFFHMGATDWVEQEKTFVDDCLYTDIEVTTDALSRVKCVNTYPVDRADLTITRTGAEADQVFVYEVREILPEGSTETPLVITVTVVGNGSTTIHDMELGNYTVTQLTGWSWRYTNDAVKSVTITGTDIGVTFGGSRINKWLSGSSELLKNVFGGS